ncbi:MAG TPA: hypothetical protein VJ932_08970, partial [Alkalispirochaeta sp.]|nr:hypothetical protein [Alkalispirochaeta sp.]
ISDSMIDISSQGYAYGVFVRNVPVELTGSAVVMRSAADGIAIATSDGALTMDHSILWLTAADEAEAGAGRITATGVSADGYGHGHSRGIDDLVIRNSTMLSYGVNEVSSTALRLGSEGAARILDSALGGWPFSLMRSTSAEVWDRSGRILSVDDLNQSRFGRGNRLQEPSLPPPRRVGTPTIPQSQLPEGLQELRRHYSQNQSGPTDS